MIKREWVSEEEYAFVPKVEEDSDQKFAMGGGGEEKEEERARTVPEWVVFVPSLRVPLSHRILFPHSELDSTSPPHLHSPSLRLSHF